MNYYYNNGYKGYKTVVKPKGRVNINIGKDIQIFCKATSKGIKQYFIKYLKEKGYEIRLGKDYLFARPNTKRKEEKIILTAHIDTVQDKKGAGTIYVNKEKGKTYLWSPKGIGGDDRCGLTIIRRVIEKGYRPTILLCDKEEIGGDGSKEFMNKYRNSEEIKDKYYCIIELDRKGNNDLVFYQEENEEWQKDIAKITGMEKAYGSFSDICNLYEMGIANVNISVGYYEQHTKDEYIIVEEVEKATKTTIKILKEVKKKYEHKEKTYSIGFNYNPIVKNYNWDNYCKEYDMLSNYKSKLKLYEVGYKTKSIKSEIIDFVEIEAYSKSEAIELAKYDYGIMENEIEYVYDLSNDKLKTLNKL